MPASEYFLKAIGRLALEAFPEDSFGRMWTEWLAAARKGRSGQASERISREAIDLAAYGVFAGELVLIAALLFFSSLKLQLFYSEVRGDPYFSAGGWSAPLDDVFIHFDFARAAARGFPFEWSEGNGYSSGGTSLLYPFVLAAGYLAGFRDTSLMMFAGIIACVSVFTMLWAARRLFRDLPAFAKYFAPPIFLSVGALNWSLWSGMEVAFFLAIWAAAFIAWDDFLRGVPGEEEAAPTWLRAALLGVAGATLVATRPEAMVVVAAFALSAAAGAGSSWSHRAAILSCTAGPAVFVIVAQAIANRLLTGDFAAAGALVKLEINDPRLTGKEVFDAWWFHVRYQVARVTGYHLAGNLVLGSLLWVVAAVPLFSRRTRRYAILLWTSAIAWVLVVALNGQVRWQNERYTMPALAWMLLSAALGLGVLCSATIADVRRSLRVRVAGACGVAALLGALLWFQAPRFRDQLWFFGRASRNIFEQHIKVARKLRQMRPKPRRVVVGDAGAIPYESDLPALDIIGLGGYGGLPFARASRWGIAAALELIERMPDSERPDFLAIYPSWWGEFPLWFGHIIDAVSVRGNVICGGPTKVIYEANFKPLELSGKPATVSGRIVDAVDLADVVSEKEHDYRIEGGVGHVTMKLLPHPQSGEPLWDAGRIVPNGARIRFTLAGFGTKGTPTIVFRLAPSQSTSLAVTLNGTRPVLMTIAAEDRWVELQMAIPSDRRSAKFTVDVSVLKNETVLYHVWGIQRP